MKHSPAVRKAYEELLDLHPELAREEEAVLDLIAKMMRAKPEIRADREFLSELRSKLVEEAGRTASSPFFSGLSAWMKFLSVPMALAAVAGIVATTGILENGTAPKAPAGSGSSAPLALNSNESAFAPAPLSDEAVSGETNSKREISAAAPTATAPAAPKGANEPTVPAASGKTRLFEGRTFAYVGKNAFGKLNATPGLGGSGPTDRMGGGMGSAAGIVAAPSPGIAAPESDSSVSSSDAPSAKMVSPDWVPTYYRYAFSGSLPEIPKESVVFLRQPKPLSNSSVAPLVNAVSFGNFDLKTLQDTKIRSLGFYEDRPYGMEMSVDFENATVSLFRNYAKWPQVSCETEECWTKNRVRADDVPDNAKILAIAEAFVRERKMDVSGYGKPFVDESWKEAYARASDKDSAYVPETVSVTYPMVLAGSGVYESYGTKKGLSVSVDVRTKRVSDVSGLESAEYVGSAYANETDPKKVADAVSRGGNPFVFAADSMPKNAKEIEVPVGNPEFVRVWTYATKDGKSVQYAVPALAFDALREPKDGEYFNRKIVVPLTKDFFPSEESLPVPVPMLRAQ